MLKVTAEDCLVFKDVAELLCTWELLWHVQYWHEITKTIPLYPFYTLKASDSYTVASKDCSWHSRITSVGALTYFQEGEKTSRLCFWLNKDMFNMAMIQREEMGP